MIFLENYVTCYVVEHFKTSFCTTKFDIEKSLRPMIFQRLVFILIFQECSFINLPYGGHFITIQLIK